jgi:hypothetical protein
MARNHAKQRALAYARAGENPDALATANGEQTINRAHARFEGTINRFTFQRIGRLSGERHALHDIKLPLAVNRMTEAVQHAAQQAGADVYTEGATERLHGAARVQPIKFAERHEEDAAFVEPHHFGEHRALAMPARDAAE